MRQGQPLPLRPAGSVPVSAAADLLEDDDGGAVFVWGFAVSCWEAGDVVGRRLAAVQLVTTGAATQKETAAAFGARDLAVREWQRRWAARGVEGLIPAKRGPRGPSRLTPEVVDDVRRRRAAGASFAAIAEAMDLSDGSVARALAEVPAPSPPQAPPTTDLEPLARPEPRDAERQAARSGALGEAPPRICEGSSLPRCGALLILPALAATGLVEAAAAVYGGARSAFYGLRSLVLAVVFATLWGEPRAEGLTRIDPTDAGRLLGLDRAPEVRTLRRRMAELAAVGKADQLLGALAARHAQAQPEAMGVLYVDGHVRAYHGGARVPKAHLARMRLSMPAEIDTWVTDARGDGLLVWSAPPGASLAGEMGRVVAEVRTLVGPDARPTIAFDRGGWSPKLFAELTAAGFDILTYRKRPFTPEPRSAFRPHTYVEGSGRRHDYLLADRRVRIAYVDEKRRRRYFAARQITRLDPDTGHQTQILTTRTDADPAPLAHAMFGRWREENFFRSMRARYGLDALDAYETTPDDLARLVPNPARKEADRALREARASLGAARQREGEVATAGGRDAEAAAAMAKSFAEAEAHVAELEKAARALPAKVPLGEVHPDAVRLDPERKRVHDAIRMATYNAESALARLLGPHYRRAEDEARSLLREAFGAPADLQVEGNELHVRINPLSAPRRSKALAGLCEDLNATETLYPGTELRLVFSVKDA